MKKLITIVLVLLATQMAAQEKISDIPAPKGFTRVEANGFGAYLRNLPLKPLGTPVKLFDGSVKSWQGGAYAVIDMEIGKSDLQQCADAIMRLRAEYLWHGKRYDEIHFNFTNGFRADYSTWAKGYRVSVKGNEVKWYKATDEDYGYTTFRKYMNIVFSYAGTASLSKELKSVPLSDLQVGDIFIIGGHPGHAMLVVDMAVDNKAILVVQSYMPAQDIHIVTNLSDTGNSPWYIISQDTEEFNFPEYHFDSSHIKRFSSDHSSAPTRTLTRTKHTFHRGQHVKST